LAPRVSAQLLIFSTASLFVRHLEKTLNLSTFSPNASFPANGFVPSSLPPPHLSFYKAPLPYHVQSFDLLMMFRRHQSFWSSLPPTCRKRLLFSGRPHPASPTFLLVTLPPSLGFFFFSIYDYPRTLSQIIFPERLRIGFQFNFSLTWVIARQLLMDSLLSPRSLFPVFLFSYELSSDSSSF